MSRVHEAMEALRVTQSAPRVRELVEEIFYLRIVEHESDVMRPFAERTAELQRRYFLEN